MAGPYPPEYGAGPAGPQMYPGSFPQHPYPPPPGAARHYPENVPSAYPGMLPPPVQYPKRRRWRAVAIALALIAVLAAIAAAIVVLGPLRQCRRHHRPELGVGQGGHPGLPGRIGGR